MKKSLGLILLAGCSGGSATLSGHGSFSVSEVLATADAGYAALLLASVDPTPTCSDVVHKSSVPFTGTAVQIGVVVIGGGALATGTFNIQSPNSVAGTFASLSLVSQLDGGVTSVYPATSGTLTLTSVGSTLAGSFSADLQNPTENNSYGQLTGQFSASTCPP